MCSIEIFSEVIKTLISRKTRLFVPHRINECDPGYLYHLNRKRSDGRLKRYSSCDDLRAWVDDEYLNYQYFLELMSDGEFQKRPFLGLIGRFIPVEVILDILCGKAPERRDIFAGWENGAQASELKPKADRAEDRLNLYNSADDGENGHLLRVVEAAINKLEAIKGILGIESCNQMDKRDVIDTKKEPVTERDWMSRPLLSPANDTETEANSAEYGRTLVKIACLRQRLLSIQQRRDQLNTKLQLSRRRTCQPASDITVTELYNREEQSNAKRLQKKIEKLITEKGEVLQDMCQSIKYLNEIKKTVNSERSHNDECQCASVKVDDKHDSGRSTLQQFGDPMKSFTDDRQRDSRVSTSKFSYQNKSGRVCKKGSSVMNRKTEIHSVSEKPMENSQGSSDTSFKSLETLPCESQMTYKISSKKKSTPDKKFKSEMTMKEVEQTLRSYEQRLGELSCLESEIEELKKKAEMADNFKKRWLRSIVRGRSQKSAVDNMKREMEELYQENCELKEVVQKITAASEKKQTEMQRLRCRAMKLVGMKQELIKLRNEVNSYQLSCESQNECIGRLENTIREQREEIDSLITKLCRATEKLRDVRKPVHSKKNVPRSRSYGPDRQICPPGNTRSATAPEEELQHSPCCRCNRRNCVIDTLNRPRSECGRRMPVRGCEAIPCQEICRNQSRYN